MLTCRRRHGRNGASRGGESCATVMRRLGGTDRIWRTDRLATVSERSGLGPDVICDIDAVQSVVIVPTRRPPFRRARHRMASANVIAAPRVATDGRPFESAGQPSRPSEFASSLRRLARYFTGERRGPFADCAPLELMVVERFGPICKRAAKRLVAE